MRNLRPDDEPARIDGSIQRQLGSGLRTTYQGILGAPVPQEQIDLVLALRRLERERRRQGPEPAGPAV